MGFAAVGAFSSRWGTGNAPRVIHGGGPSGPDTCSRFSEPVENRPCPCNVCGQPENEGGREPGPACGRAPLEDTGFPGAHVDRPLLCSLICSLHWHWVVEDRLSAAQPQRPPWSQRTAAPAPCDASGSLEPGLAA